VLLNTVLSAYAEYFYFHYDFDGIVLLPADSAPGLNRHGVRAGLSLVLPIVSARRTGAAR
jgi:hypothetical protein